MPFFVWQRTIVDDEGNTLSGASVEVRDQVTSSLIQLYSDVDGQNAIGNPITADANGFVQFYAATGRYRIESTSGAFSAVWDDERFGYNADEFNYDVTALEIDAGVTPVNFQYSEDDPRRDDITDDYSGGTGTDNQAALQARLTAGYVSQLPVINNGLVIGGAISVPYNTGIVGRTVRPESIVRLLSSYATNANAFTVNDGCRLENLSVRGEGTDWTDNPAKGVAYSLNGDVKWCKLDFLTAQFVNVCMFYGNGAYYNNMRGGLFAYANKGIHINGTASGSLAVDGKHFRYLKEAITQTIGNEIVLNRCTFEFNQYDLVISAGHIQIQNCYQSDGAKAHVKISGGHVEISGKGLYDTSTQIGFLKSAGATVAWTDYGESAPSASTPTYSVEGRGGEVRLSNITLWRNIHASVGIINVTYQNGADLLFDGTTYYLDNVRCLDYVPWSLQSGAFVRGTPINSYVINGSLVDAPKVPFDLVCSETVNAGGTHDGSDDAATLTDSGESWTTNFYVGWTVYNLTDGSKGTITANNGTTITATLSGGTGNDWDSGDVYAIYPATADASKRNIWSGNAYNIQGTGDSSSQYIQMRFHVPKHLVGKVCYVALVLGQTSGLSNAQLSAPNIDFTDADGETAVTPGTLSAGNYLIANTDCFEDHPRVHWLPGRVNAPEGYIQYQMTNHASAAYSIEFYGILLVSRNDAYKVAPVDDASLHRTAAAQPSIGYWYLGEYVENREPALTEAGDWVNTSAGTPGVFKKKSTVVA